MIAYCLGPRSRHLISTVGSSLSVWGTAVVTGMTANVAAANRPSSESSSEFHPLCSQPSNCSLCCELSQSWRLDYTGRCLSDSTVNLFPSFCLRRRAGSNRLWIFSMVIGSSSWHRAYYLQSKFLAYWSPLMPLRTIFPLPCYGQWPTARVDPSSDQGSLQLAWASFCSCWVFWRACCWRWSVLGGNCPIYWQENSISKCRHRELTVLTERDDYAAFAPMMKALRRFHQTDCFPFPYQES